MEILNYRDVIDKPNVIGEFDVYLPDEKITVYNCRVIRSKNGKLFTNWPQYGKKIGDAWKFYSLITFSDEKQKGYDDQMRALITSLVSNKEPPF